MEMLPYVPAPQRLIWKHNERRSFKKLSFSAVSTEIKFLKKLKKSAWRKDANMILWAPLIEGIKRKFEEFFEIYFVR